MHLLVSTDSPVSRRTFGLTTARWCWIAVILAAFALRVLALGGKSLWVDEADSVYFAQHAWGDLIWRLCDPHPPGYYALLKAAIGVAGVSEFVVRLPSALAGTLAVAVLARLTAWLKRPADQSATTMRAFTKAAAGVPIWLPAALLAVAPLHVWYSQEARMYALVTLLCLGAASIVVRAARRPHPQAAFALAYAIIATGAVLADQSAALPLGTIALIVIFICIQRKALSSLAAWLGLQVIPVAAFVLWYQRASFAAHINANTFYPLTMFRMVIERGKMSAGVVRGLAIAGGVGLVALVVWVRNSSQRSAVSGQRMAVNQISGGKHQSNRAAKDTAENQVLGTDSRADTTLRKRVTRFVAWMILVAYVGGTVFSVVPRLYTVKRLVVSMLPYACLAGAWAMATLSAPHPVLKRWGYVAILTSSLVLSLVNVFAVPKTPWREVIAEVTARVQPDDTVWVDELAVPAFDYYNRDGTARQVLAARDLETLAGATLPPGNLWLIVQAGRYRNPLDFLPGLAALSPSYASTWHTVEVRAYAAADLDPAALQPDVPDWAFGWPSPLDSACQPGL